MRDNSGTISIARSRNLSLVAKWRLARKYVVAFLTKFSTTDTRVISMDIARRGPTVSTYLRFLVQNVRFSIFDNTETCRFNLSRSSCYHSRVALLYTFRSVIYRNIRIPLEVLASVNIARTSRQLDRRGRGRSRLCSS